MSSIYTEAQGCEVWDNTHKPPPHRGSRTRPLELEHLKGLSLESQRHTP